MAWRSESQSAIAVGKNGSQYQDTISYTFDGGNRLTQAVDSTAGTIARTYDGLDRMTEEQSPQGDITYAYDNANRRTSMTVAGQTAVSYAWDNANRLNGITQGTASVSFAYDNANRRTTLTLPNGVTVAYTYDNSSRITGLSYAMGSTQLGNLGYSYDADGKVTAKTGSLAATGMPTSVSANTFNADNAMTGFNGATLTYDANGNLTADGTNTYTWDARNHLGAISGAATASFVYDAFGRRSGKTINGIATQLLYDALNPVQELQSGSPSANLLTGLNIDEYFQHTDSNGAMDFLTDALGSTIGLTNSSGALATNYTYQPFGATTLGGTANANPYQFTGRENDGAGLYFYRARYYSASYQRFISQDPLEFGGDNPLLYAYVWQNPVNLRDSLGLICDPGTGMAIGYVLGLGAAGVAVYLFPAAGLDPGIFQIGASLGSFAGRQAYMYLNPDCNPDNPPPDPDNPGPNPDNPPPGAPQPPNGPCA